MATVKAPLFGLGASGTIANALVFSNWRGRPYVRRHVTPTNPRSGLQVGIRSVFKYISQAYAALSGTMKAAWELEAAADNITGLNAMQRTDVDRARRNFGWIIEPNPPAVTMPDAPTGGTATAAPKSLNLAWVRPVANQGDYTAAIYMSVTAVFTPDISNLICVQTVTVLTYTVKGLTTGTPYYFQVRETNTDGDLGALSAEFTGTPT